MNRSGSNNKVDMLNGSLANKILKVAIPLAAISILQQMFNAADVAVVGRFASKDALAAVGANTPIISMFITLFTGLATGGNVAIATLIGKGKTDEINDAVQTVYTLSLIGGILIVFLGELLAGPIHGMVSTPDNIKASSLLYLRIYFFAMMFAVIYNFASAILRSMGDTKRPLYCLVVSGIINVLLNLFFVIVLKMGVAGVALATLIANAVCATSTIVILSKEEHPMKLSVKSLKLVRNPLTYTIRLGLPAGIQGMLFSISNVVIQSAVNSFGSDCIAGNTAAMNFEFISYFVISAFSQTATTFISQNYGAKKIDRCRKSLVLSMILGIALCFSVSAVFVFFKGSWLRLFTTDAEALSYAFTRMKCIVFFEFMTGLYEITAASLRGMGVSVPPTIITIIGSCVFRVIWVNTVFRMSHTYATLLCVYPVSWALISVSMAILYFATRKMLERKMYVV